MISPTDAPLPAASARVAGASAGRLGYVHIEAMGTGSLLEFERALEVKAPPLLGDHNEALRSGASPWEPRDSK